MHRENYIFERYSMSTGCENLRKAILVQNIIMLLMNIDNENIDHKNIDNQNTNVEEHR